MRRIAIATMLSVLSVLAASEMASARNKVKLIQSTGNPAQGFVFVLGNGGLSISIGGPDGGAAAQPAGSTAGGGAPASNGTPPIDPGKGGKGGNGN